MGAIALFIGASTAVFGPSAVAAMVVTVAGVALVMVTKRIASAPAPVPPSGKDTSNRLEET